MFTNGELRGMSGDSGILRDAVSGAARGLIGSCDFGLRESVL